MSFRSMFGALSELVADSITGAMINGGTITGAIIQTAAAGKRFVMQPEAFGTYLTGFIGVDAENTPATLDVSGGGDVGQPGIGQLFLTGPSMWNAARNQACGQGTFYVAGRGDTSPPRSEIKGSAAQIELEADGGADLLLAGTQATLTGNLAVTGATVVDDTLDVTGAASVDGLLTAAGGIDLTGQRLDLSGDSIRRIRFGSDVVSITSGNSTGTKSVAHGQGVAPDLVLVSAANGVIGYYANVDTYNTTNISLRASQRDGTAGAASVTVNWLAIWA